MTAWRGFFKRNGGLTPSMHEGDFMKAIVLCALAVLALAGCAGEPLTQTNAVTAVSTSDAGAAATMISAYRTAHGLSPVTVDSRLNRAAEFQARTVAGAGKLSHE
jgi:uncharacterized protein YkwD